MKYCPDCGEKLEPKNKFCPNCGINLRNETSSKKVLVENESDAAKVICPNCGDENPSGNLVCESCGVKLVPGKLPRWKDHSRSGNRLKKATEEKTNPAGEAVLDKTKVIYVSIGILAILLLVLYLSGIFETVPSSGKAQNVQQQGTPGVNMNNLQRINELETRLKNEPQNMQLLLEIAHLKNDSGLYEQAIKDYQKYLETNPADADARIDMGVCYYNLQQYEPAITAMKKALEYSPMHQIGHLNLGIVNLAAGNLEESKLWLSKAVQINPGSEIGKKAQELLQSH